MSSVTIYHSGPVAWLWRVLIGFGLLGGLGALIAGATTGEPALLIGGVALLAPAIYFGSVVAVSIDHLDEEFISVVTLLFRHRRIAISQLAVPRYRENYEDESGTLHAPRLWVSVRGQWPVYIDLLGDIPDKQLFGTAFGLKQDAYVR